MVAMTGYDVRELYVEKRNFGLKKLVKSCWTALAALCHSGGMQVRFGHEVWCAFPGCSLRAAWYRSPYNQRIALDISVSTIAKTDANRYRKYIVIPKNNY
jgi:hypothetical protein